MKIATSFLASILFIGTLGALHPAMSAEGIIYQQVFTPESYCHMKFPAIREDTLFGPHPVLKDPTNGDIIDYYGSYGSCDEDPLGQDQVQTQREEYDQHRSRSDRES